MTQVAAFAAAAGRSMTAPAVSVDDRRGKAVA
jgi:hypothetical protein